MPNTSNDDVIIVGSLSDKELRDSIDKLVDYVGKKTTDMAGNFVVAMNTMKGAMKDFAVSQKVSVDLMQDAWKKMSVSFDAMLKAQQNATSSGNNSGAGGSSAQSNTIAELRERIKEQAKIVDQQQRGTVALQEQVNTQGKLKNQLKEELRTTEQITRARVKEDTKLAKQLPSNNIQQIERQIQILERVRERMRNAGFFKESEILSISRQIDKLREKIDKIRIKQPLKMKDVLGMDESSVDAIAKKMAALKKVTVDPQNTAQVKQLGDEYQRLKRLQAELMGQNIQMTHSNNYLAQSFGYIRNRLVYAMTLGAITSFTKQVYEIRGQYELLERSLGVLVNSFERGSQIFQELNQMAIESPFTLMELAGAAKQLTAYNFAANEVVDTTRRLADISAALGVPMERLTYNLGQIRAQTVLTARDARDFANAGLPIVASLAEHFTELEGKIVTTGDVYDRMSKKMVSYSDVMTVLNKMTDEGGKFFEFQAKQAETLRVQMANLNLAWNNMLNDIGKSNQGLLTLPISGLKALFQNWQSIDRVLKSMLVTFGLWKALQMVAIRQQWAWATATGATAKQMGWLANGIKAVGASLKALFLNPWTWVFVGIMAVVDLVNQTNAARGAMHELNQEIRDNANEASESMLNYLNNKGNKSTLELAKQNKLTAEQGERAWESLKQQIEQSALSANGLIAELLAIEDVNERVRVGFDYAERIQKAQAALQDLKDDSIEVNTDVGWFGMFGEGLVSDLKDYADYIEKYSEIARNNQMAGEVAAEWMHQVGIVKGARQEFLEELDDTAESINNFIRAYNITDPLQINEILERVRSQIKAKNPEIKGEAAKIFDISLDQKMAELTNGAVDRNASLWNMFMERLKHNSSSAFQDINDDWIKSNEALSSEQQAAVDANLQYFKDSMPYAYQAVSEMVSDASKLKIHIGIAFNVQQLSDFQKEVNQRIGNAVGGIDFGGGAFLPTNNDNLSSWVKTQQQAIKSLGEENKKYALDDSQWSKEKIAANDREIQQRKNLLDLFHQQYAEEKKGRGGGNRKDEDQVAEALRQELSIIKEMQGNYDKLRKAGVSNMDAIDLASKGYEATIIRINQVLSKFGIDKFNAANFAGKDVRSLLQSLEEQRQALLASGKVKTSSLQALDVEIQKLTVDAKTYDMKKVTDGLNSELGKLKDEYELAVELDANPELGDMFADMFDIDTESLPHTIDQYADNVLKALNKSFNERNIDLNLPTLDLTSDDIKAYKDMLDTGVLDQETFNKIKKSSEEIKNLRKKDAKDTFKQTQELQYKLADTNGKIAIEEKKLSILQEKYAKETQEEKKRLLELQIQDQQNAIAKLKEEVLQLLPTYTYLFNSIAEHSASVTRRLAKQWKDALNSAVLNADGTYTITDPLSGEKATITAKQYGTQIDKVNGKLRETQTSWQKIKEAFTKDKYGIVDWQQGLVLVGNEISNIANGLQELSSILEDVGVKFSDDVNYAIEGLSQVGSGVSEFAQGFASGNWIQATVGGIKAVVGLGKTAAGIFGGTKKDYFTELNNSLQGLLDTLNKVADYQLESLGKMTGSKAASEYRKLIENNEMAIKSYRDLANARGKSGSSWGSHSYAYRTNRDLENDWAEISKFAGQTITSIQDMYNLSPENLKEIMTNMPVQWSKIDGEIRKALESIIEYGDKANEYTEALGVAMTNMSLDDLTNDFESMLQDMDSDAEEFSENFEEYMRNAIIRSMMVGTYASELENWYNNFKKRITDDQLSDSDIVALREEYMDIVNRAITERDKLLSVVGTSTSSGNLSALQQGIQSISEDTASALEAYMNGVSQQVYLQSDILTQIRDAVVGFDMDVQLGVFSQMLLQLQQSYVVQQNIERLLQNVINPSGRAFMVELAS